MSERHNRELRVSIGNPRSNTETWVEVRVEDRASGALLAEFVADPASWYALLHGGTQYFPGCWGPDLHLAGKRMENTAYGLDLPLYGNDEAAALEAAKAKVPEGWENYERIELRRTNAGWGAVLRRWVDPEI